MSAAARLEELKKRYDENPRRFFAPLANEYRKSGDLEHAIALCQQHLAEQPGNMNGHVVYGQALYESGRLDEAAATFETALTLDPENLIALRHLGDIARTNGDGQRARGWYARVLDADPRNEEIIAFIAEIDSAFLAAPSAPVSAAAASAPPAPESPPAPAAPTSREALGEAVTQQVVAQRAPVPTPRATTPVAAQSVEAAAASPATASPGEDVPTPVRAQAPAPSSRTAPVSPPPRTSMDLMDLSIDLSAQVDEQPPSALGAHASPEPGASADLASFGDISFGEAAPADAAPVPTLGESATSPLPDGLDFGDLDFSMDAPSNPALHELGAQQSAPPSEPPIELPSAPPSHAPFEPVEAPLEMLHAEPDVPGLQFDEPEEAPSTSPDLAAVPESGPPPVDDRPASGADALPSVGEPARPFVTETMAELYLQQGFRAEALAVYRQLADESPLEPRLKERVRELESGEAAADSQAGVRPEQVVPVDARTPLSVERIADSSPSRPAARTVREFFSFLASRRALRHDGTPPRGMAVPDVPATGTDGAPAPRVSSGGTLDALFGNVEVAGADEHVALAFARVAEAVDPVVIGKPTQPAQSELSLDHVFRDTPSRSRRVVPRHSEKLRFDQFFTPASEKSVEAPPSAPPPPTGEPGSPEELEQFHDWLQHLKKP